MKDNEVKDSSLGTDHKFLIAYAHRALKTSPSTTSNSPYPSSGKSKRKNNNYQYNSRFEFLAFIAK